MHSRKRTWDLFLSERYGAALAVRFKEGELHVAHPITNSLSIVSATREDDFSPLLQQNHGTTDADI